MAVSATAKNTGISVKKLLPIVDLVRGMNVEDALNTLEFLPSPAAASVARVVKSAAANAENEIFARPEDLTITENLRQRRPPPEEIPRQGQRQGDENNQAQQPHYGCCGRGRGALAWARRLIR